jgi:ribosomal protein S18 acetylase RimI-like enzyme
MITIAQADTPDAVETARGLFVEYSESLDSDLCFQGFDGELAQLPSYYSPPSRRLLLASVDDAVAGCAALRDLGDGVCEIKRLYVRPACRGYALGRRLAEAIIGEARAIGYERMCLDTLPTMKTARALYDDLGFSHTAPYYHNPIEGAVYMELDLKNHPG